MPAPVVTMNVTDFKAKCLALFDDLEGHKVAKVIVTRHGRPVAALTPPVRDWPSLHGAQAGSGHVVGDYDLTQPTFATDEFDAERG